MDKRNREKKGIEGLVNSNLLIQEIQEPTSEDSIC